MANSFLCAGAITTSTKASYIKRIQNFLPSFCQSTASCHSLPSFVSIMTLRVLLVSGKIPWAVYLIWQLIVSVYNDGKEDAT